MAVLIEMDCINKGIIKQIVIFVKLNSKINLSCPLGRDNLTNDSVVAGMKAMKAGVVTGREKYLQPGRELCCIIHKYRILSNRRFVVQPYFFPNSFFTALIMSPASMICKTYSG